ncbi:hypothetical protein Rsub_04014 [Raphidocelis subcapitata]|uniref:Glycosyltransferase family 92 protein n=1 Tax=Raphidocelis subcapitata TaxID=307507 RepID=A0A2V0P1J8_9CHLO|nr:hypothetical protein Rsub_04014 [Raphidocelis subcapitata]|eukprot:GBF91710.1 hypothetical protein Rsub_04014 [Raphidocelis subcapitata]
MRTGRGPTRGAPGPSLAAVAAAAALLLAAAALPACAQPAGAAGGDTFDPRRLRTTSAASVHDAATFGGLQAFTLPVAEGTCPPASVHGFAKCVALPGGGQAWRVLMAWARVGLRRLENVAHDLSSLGGPYGCEAPAFHLEPVPRPAGAPPPRARGAPVPLRVREGGGLAFYPRALEAFVAPEDAAPGYALRVTGSGDKYFVVLDAAGGCRPPAEPLSVRGGPGGCRGTGRAGGGGDDYGGGAEGGDDAGGSGAEGGGGGAEGGGAACGDDGDPAWAMRAAPGRLPATNWVVISVPPTWNDDLSSHVARLRAHVEWHQGRLGFTGHLLYLDPSQASRLLLDPPFRRLLARHRIAVLRWGGSFPRVGWLPWDAQGLRLSHGFLAFWGSDVGLLPIDVDEFLVPGPAAAAAAAPAAPAAQGPGRAAALRELLSRCGGGGGAGAVAFERFALFCGGDACPGGDEPPLWLRAAQADANASAAAGGSVATAESGAPAEIGRDVPDHTSPLAAYDEVEAAPHAGDKYWATSACVWPVSVHGVRTAGLPTGCARLRAAPDCARLLHLINAFHMRAARDEEGRELGPFEHPWWPRRGQAPAAAAEGA